MGKGVEEEKEVYISVRRTNKRTIRQLSINDEEDEENDTQVLWSSTERSSSSIFSFQSLFGDTEIGQNDMAGIG